MIAVKIKVSELGRSDLALLVTDGQREAWVPFSQIEEIEEEPTGPLRLVAVTAIVIPDWLAKEKGLEPLQQDDDTLDLFGDAS
jgi:hypothetical protein